MRPSSTNLITQKRIPPMAAILVGAGGQDANDLRVGAIFRNDFKLIAPSSPFTKNISLSASGKSVLPACPVLSRQEGRIAIVTNAGEDAVDAAASGAQGLSQGGSFRERQWRADDRRSSSNISADSTWSVEVWLAEARVRQNRVVLSPVAGVKSAEARSAQPGLIAIQFAGDGDKTNSSPGRARHKP